MKWVAIIIFSFALVLAGFKGNKTERVIEAEKIVLRGSNGKALLELSVDENRPTIVLCDEKGKERIQLTGGAKPGIAIKNNSDQIVAQLRDFDKDGSGFVLYDHVGRKRFQLQGSDRPGLFMLNDNKEIIANLGTHADGYAQFQLSHKGDQSVLTMNGSETPSLILSNGRHSQMEFLTSQQGSLVKFNDLDGNARVQLQGGTSSGVFLRDQEGQVIGSLIALKHGGSALGLANANGEIATFLRGGSSPSLSFFQTNDHPDIILGITEKAPHLLMSREKDKEGVLMYGGSPSSVLFVNERGQVPVILSKHGLMQDRKTKGRSKKKPQQDKFYSWEEREESQKR